MFDLAKAYRRIKIQLLIAKSRTGKPTMVTLKMQFDCSTVHDTTLWAEICVRSHLGCGTHSVFIGLTDISKMQKRCKWTGFWNLVKFDIWNPENNRDLNQVILHLWSKFGDPSLNGGRVIARTSWGLTHTYGHTQTDAGNDNTRKPKLVSDKNRINERAPCIMCPSPGCNGVSNLHQLASVSLVQHFRQVKHGNYYRPIKLALQDLCCWANRICYAA